MSDLGDLVERLRKWERQLRKATDDDWRGPSWCGQIAEAADALKAQEKEIERLREQYQEAGEMCSVYGDHKKTCLLRNTPASESLCNCGWRKVILSPGWCLPRAPDGDREPDNA